MTSNQIAILARSLFFKFRFSSIGRGALRSVTPLLIALFSNEMVQTHITSLSDGRRDALIVGAYTAYYFVARNIEKYFPQAGVLLFGAKGAPIYEINQSQEEIAAIGAEDVLVASGEERTESIPYS